MRSLFQSPPRFSRTLLTVVAAGLAFALAPSVFAGTNRRCTFGRLIASQIASASAASFLPRSTYGLVYCGGIRTTS
jgi:hypothetical protein